MRLKQDGSELSRDDVYGNGCDGCESASCYARYPTHAMKPHEWGIHVCGGFTILR